MSSRTLVSVALTALFLGSVSGCTKNEPPKPDPSAAATTSAATTRPKFNMRTPIGPMARLDPQAMKTYRVDVCYYGTLSLRQARDSYLASLGKDEPSEKKIPSFGALSSDAKPTGSGAPAAAVPPRPPTPPAKPVASGAPAANSAAATPPPGTPTRPFDFALRAPHERNARACTAAVGLKEPAMAGVDEALAAYAPFAVELAKDIAAATSYYQREEYKKDAFAKGKELHKKLLEEFGKLDEQQSKLAAAVDAYHKDHVPDATKMEEGEKTVSEALADARKVVIVLAEKKVDVAAYKANVEKLEKSVETIKTFSTAHPTDMWSKMMMGPFDAFVHAAKEAKVTEKGFGSEDFLNLITNFTNLIEIRQRGLQKALNSRSQTAMPAPGDSAAPAPAPTAQP
jgi:Protein of unknown function (DUF3829)